PPRLLTRGPYTSLFRSVRGQWIDPLLGRQIFGDYAAAWRAAQVHDEATAAMVERTLRLHILPTFGSRPLAAVRRMWRRRVRSTIDRKSTRLNSSHVAIS